MEAEVEAVEEAGEAVEVAGVEVPEVEMGPHAKNSVRANQTLTIV